MCEECDSKLCQFCEHSFRRGIVRQPGEPVLCKNCYKEWKEEERRIQEREKKEEQINAIKREEMKRKTPFGDYGKKIQVALDKLGMATQLMIRNDVKLSSEEVYGGLGWLACEGKIYIHRAGKLIMFSISDSMNTPPEKISLDEFAGKNAYKILDALLKVGVATPLMLRNETKLCMEAMFTGLGWLACEGKITLEHDGKLTKYKLIS